MALTPQLEESYFNTLLNLSMNFVGLLQVHLCCWVAGHIIILKCIQMNITPGDDFLDMLMSGKGEEYLDRQIARVRSQVGEQQFQAFAIDFFRRQGSENVYAEIEQEQKKPKPTHQKQKKKEETAKKSEPAPQEEKIKEEELISNQVTENEPDYVFLTDEAYLTSEKDETVAEEEDEDGDGDDEMQEISRKDLGEGNFEIHYSNGDTYVGEMAENGKEGWGTYMYKNGEKYSGCFDEDEIHGYGRYYFQSGADYEGDWSSGMKHGIGILNFGNGNSYEGGFVRDEFHGKGVYRYSNGDVFEGMWKAGMKNGRGKLQTKDGGLKIGQWKDDVFEMES